MIFPITEQVAKSQRHTSFYLACGISGATSIIFLHGWRSCRSLCDTSFQSSQDLAFFAVAPDLLGYGRSSVYPRHEDYALEEAVADMIELTGAIGVEKAIWVGHDRGSPVVWSIAQHHPERCHGVVSLCVPYIPEGFPPKADLFEAGPRTKRCGVVTESRASDTTLISRRAAQPSSGVLSLFRACWTRLFCTYTARAILLSDSYSPSDAEPIWRVPVYGPQVW